MQLKKLFKIKKSLRQFYERDQTVQNVDLTLHLSNWIENQTYLLIKNFYISLSFHSKLNGGLSLRQIRHQL